LHFACCCHCCGIKQKKEDEKKWGKTKTKSGEGAAGECCGAEVNEDSLGL